jgi:hypothetical protein
MFMMLYLGTVVFFMQDGTVWVVFMQNGREIKKNFDGISGHSVNLNIHLIFCSCEKSLLVFLSRKEGKQKNFDGIP